MAVQSIPGIMNTAILYDLENLVGGWGDRSFAALVDLGDLITRVRKMRMIGGIAVERAYTNWKLPPWSVIRVVSQFGVEPIQMYSFGFGNTANASDLMLAVDAIELVISHPGINRVVIVSGDGGFAPLLNRLRNHGKLVGGAGYSNTTARVLRPLCHEWLDLGPAAQPAPGPASQRPTSRSVGGQPALPLLGPPAMPVASAGTSQPALRAQVAEVVPAPTTLRTAQDAFAYAQQVVHAVAAAPAAQADLLGRGVEVSVFLDAFRSRVEGFAPTWTGYASSVELLRAAAVGTVVRLIANGATYRVLAREAEPPNGYDEVTDPEQPHQPHTVDNYRQLLARAKPPLTPQPRLPTPTVLARVFDHLAQSPPEVDPIPDVRVWLMETLGLSQDDARAATATLQAARLIHQATDEESDPRHTTGWRFAQAGPDVMRQAVADLVRVRLAQLLLDPDPQVTETLLDQL